MRIKTTLTAAMLLLIAVPGNASADDVDQRRMKWDKTIKAAKDFDTLKLMCADEIIRTPPGRSRHEACKVLLSGVVSLLNTKTTCKTIIKTWKTLHKK